jgi:4-amino-4-deoxy-L-arabinose transferase-like glycosyltransferase
VIAMLTGAARGPQAADGSRSRVREAVGVLPLVLLYFAICVIADPGPHPVRDEPALLAVAERLLDGQLVPSGRVLDPRAYLWHGPGLVVLLAPLVALELPLAVIRLIEPLLLSAAVLLFHRLLRERLAPRPALAWTYALGLYVPFFAVLPEIHKEPVAVLLVVAGMLALTRGLASGRRMPFVFAGLALGALAMVRLEYGWVAFALLAVAVGAWVRRRRSASARRLVLAAAVAVAACLPWLAYTYHLTGRPMYWGSSSGLSLFWMSPTVPGETGTWQEPAAVEHDPALAQLRPFFRHVATLHPVASDDALRERALDNIRARPLLYVRNIVANVGRLFFAWPTRPQLSVRRIGANVIFNGLLLGVVAWAAAAAWRRRLSLPPQTVPIVLFAALGIAIHLPVSASPRMLLPLVPALVWFAAQVLSRPAGARGA